MILGGSFKKQYNFWESWNDLNNIKSINNMFALFINLLFQVLIILFNTLVGLTFHEQIISFYMELPLGNFLQVTINSNKLYSFIEDIIKKIDHQQSRQVQLSRLVSHHNKDMDQRLSTLHHSMLVEMQKTKKINQEENNYVKLYVKDMDKKINDKVIELQGGIAQLSKKINQTKEVLEQDLSIKLSYFEKKIENSTALEQMQTHIKSQMAELVKSIEEMKNQSRLVEQNWESNVKAYKQMYDGLADRINTLQLTKRSQMQNWQLNASFKEVQSPAIQKRKLRKKDTLFEHIQGVGNSIDLRIQQLSSKLDGKGSSNPPKVRRSIISNNKIVKYNQGSKKIIKKGGHTKSQQALRQLQNTLLSKLQKIEQLSIAKLSAFEKQIYKQNNKSQVIDEHIGILSRKIQKEKARINQVTDIVKMANDKKIDQKMVQGLKNIVKKVSKDLQEAIEQKVTRDTYQKERQRMHEKIDSLIEVINQKADKPQVRKGLSFLQQKLKQVIIVVAQQKSSNQDGAVKKTPFKCLSCDKDLQADKFQSTNGINHRLNKQNSSSNIRCNVTQMRKRIRMINNTVTTVNIQE